MPPNKVVEADGQDTYSALLVNAVLTVELFLLTRNVLWVTSSHFSTTD